MKIIQLIGTRNKSDFAVYLSDVLTSLGKRVLLVDATQKEWYKNGYARLAGDQFLFDFQGIDILCGVKNWLDIEERLMQVAETTVNYDVIMVDVDTTEIMEQDWPKFDERIYVGDFDRAHQLLDAELIQKLIQASGNNELKHITFESKYKMNANYIESLVEETIQWRSMNYIFEADEFSEELRTYMQHEQEIPYKRLNKQYKVLLAEIVSALFELHIKDVTDAVKPSFFRSRSKERKPKHREIIEGLNV